MAEAMERIADDREGWKDGNPYFYSIMREFIKQPSTSDVHKE